MDYTLDEIQALVGQTFGSGKNQRTVTRIKDLENIKTSTPYGPVERPYFRGEVYWKRPGGKERSTSQWLPYFLVWMRKAVNEANHIPVTTIEDVEHYLSEIPEGTELEGFIDRQDDEVTIVFKIKPTEG